VPKWGNVPLVLSVQSVSKRYQLYRRPSDRIATALGFGGKSAPEDFWALRNISFELNRGEILGIIGANGSGKSTLLQIVAGVLRPTSGRVSVEGRVAALLELGAGFNPEFTGRENVYFNSEVMGRSTAETNRVFPKIEAFAEIGHFIDRPVKEYSSGMYVRLAFATAIHVEPDVLIVDEALAVGDAVFANRCIRKLDELKAAGVSILFVSHDLGIVKRLCHRAMLLHGGETIAQGEPSKVVNQYIALVHERDPEAVERYESTQRHGDSSSEILGAELLDQEGRPALTVQNGQRVRARVRARFRRDVENPVVGILIRNRLGIDVYGTNTLVEGVQMGSFCSGDELVVDFEFAARLTRQAYTLTAALQHPDGRSQDWRDDLLEFTVVDAREHAGLADLDARVRFDVLRASRVE
jgi:lipopolysaccharide transport system ATP-binding protein